MTECHKDILVFHYKTEGNRIYEITDSQCDYEFRLELDPSDMSSHQLFNAFGKVLMAMGFGEKTIMSGACGLAFNEMRDLETMVKVAKEFDLFDLETELEDTNRRKALYESSKEQEDDTI